MNNTPTSTSEGNLNGMNAPSRAMRPLPHSSIGGVPDIVTRDLIAERINRLQAVGRSGVGNETARQLLAMVERYAESFRTQPAQRSVPNMRQSAPSDAGPDTRELERLRELAATRGTALSAANETVAGLTHDVDVLLWLHAEAVWTGRHDFDVARAEVTRLSRDLDTVQKQHREALQQVKELEAVCAATNEELTAARSAVQELDSAHAAADYHASQAARRGADLEQTRTALNAAIEHIETTTKSAGHQAELVAELEARVARLEADLTATQDAAAGRAALDEEIARLERELAAAPHGVTVTLTAEQIAELRAELQVELATIPEGHRQCSACRVVKPVEEFHLRSKTDPAGRRHSKCKGCTNTRRHPPQDG